MRVVITGAAGRIGRQLVEELAGKHQLCLIDRVSIPRQDSCVADLGQRSGRSGWRMCLPWKTRPWSELLVGCDVVVHLAANIKPRAPWDKVLPDNIQGTWNVIEAAAHHHVPSVIFASSNWAVKAVEQRLAPNCYLPDGPKISSDVDPHPITPYGVSKAFGEIAGRMLVDEGRLRSFVAVRIGNYNLRPPEKELLRTRWIGADDIRSLFRRCVEAEFQGFHVVYGVSAQPEVPYDLAYTSRLLSWKPQQLP